MEENNNFVISDLEKIICELNSSNKGVIVFWDSNIYNNEEQLMIKNKASELNYYLIDSKLANMIKIIESCREILSQESKRLDDNNTNPLIILKENNIKNEYIFNFPRNTKAMYNIIKDECIKYNALLLTKQSTTYKKYQYINYNDFINIDLPQKELIDTSLFEYLDEYQNYSINYVIPTFIDIMKPKIKYELIKDKNNTFILKSKNHEIKFLLVDDVNNNVDIFKYNLIIETNDFTIPNESLLKNSTINDIYIKEQNILKSIRG